MSAAGMFDDAPDRATAINQALGAASVCWENIDRAGVFDADRALEISQALQARLEQLEARPGITVDVSDLPAGWTPLEAAVLFKCLDDEGVVRLAQRFTPGLSTWEGLGMVQAAAGTLQADLNESFETEGDSDAP